MNNDLEIMWKVAVVSKFEGTIPEFTWRDLRTP